jgi:DNA-binding Lrp family transcriptional regulator
MDILDAGVIRELTGPEGAYQWNARRSYSGIARRLGVDEETVRRRVRAAERRGLVTGSELVMNPYLIGREPIRVLLKATHSERAKRTAISQIKLVDGTLLIIDMYGEGLQLLLFCRSYAVDRTTRLVSSIAGCDEPVVLRNLEGLGFYPSKINLTDTDIKILRSLRRSPRKSTHQIADEVGVSTRTVERRLAFLTEEKAFFHMLRLDFRKSEGVTCSIVVSYLDEGKKGRIDRMISSRLDRIIFLATAARTTSQFNFVCDNVAEAGSIKEWIERLDGVSHAEMGIIREYILTSEWLDEDLQNMLAK